MNNPIVFPNPNISYFIDDSQDHDLPFLGASPTKRSNDAAGSIFTFLDTAETQATDSARGLPPDLAKACDDAWLKAPPLSPMPSPRLPSRSSTIELDLWLPLTPTSSGPTRKRTERELDPCTPRTSKRALFIADAVSSPADKPVQVPTVAEPVLAVKIETPAITARPLPAPVMGIVPRKAVTTGQTFAARPVQRAAAVASRVAPSTVATPAVAATQMAMVVGIPMKTATVITAHAQILPVGKIITPAPATVYRAP